MTFSRVVRALCTEECCLRAQRFTLTLFWFALRFFILSLSLFILFIWWSVNKRMSMFCLTCRLIDNAVIKSLSQTFVISDHKWTAVRILATGIDKSLSTQSQISLPFLQQSFPKWYLSYCKKKWSWMFFVPNKHKKAVYQALSEDRL